MSAPLTDSELAKLPPAMVRRYWAAEISHGVPGLSDLLRDDVRRECRDWIAWVEGLRPGAAARYVGIATALLGKTCELAAVWHAGPIALFSVRIPDFPSPFLVGPHDLAPAR